MKILIGADIVPTQSNKDFFSAGNVNLIIDENLQNKLKQADFRVFNLEVPLSDVKSPIQKCGPNLIAPTSCIKVIKKLAVDLFTLANNHIMDHDVQGLESTIEILDANNINYVGAGNNLSEAHKPYIIEKDGIKVGIYACAEHEFSIAGENYPGANPFDSLESPDHIISLKKQCDYVIVLYHGGKEHYRYPSPYLQKACRKMCDKGADLVVCQHSHCIGCEEKYNQSTIVYGQGNFIFDAKSDEYWDSSLLIEADFSDKMKVEYIPLEKRNNIINLSEDEAILDGFYKRSEEIKNYGYIEKKYTEFAETMIQRYICDVAGVSIPFRILNKLCGHRLKRKISKKRILAIRNYIECEAHRDLFLRGIKNDYENFAKLL